MDLDYGVKQWAIGYFGGCAYAIAAMSWIEGWPFKLSWTGLAIILYFASFRLRKPKVTT